MSRHRSTSIRLDSVHRTNGPVSNDLKSKLQALVPLSSTQITDLSDVGKYNYQSVVETIKSTYDTPAYNDVYTQINAYFYNITPIPGTVGGYFAGCLRHNQFPENPGCAMSCVNAVQPPENTGFQPCKILIIQATFVNGNYMFRSLNSDVVASSHQAYIYVDSMTLNDFKGFSVSERQHLNSLGISEISIVSPRQLDGSYINLTDGFLPLADIHSRVDEVENNQNSTNWWAVLLVILIIIFIIWLLSRSYQMN